MILPTKMNKKTLKALQKITPLHSTVFIHNRKIPYVVDFINIDGCNYLGMVCEEDIFDSFLKEMQHSNPLFSEIKEKAVKLKGETKVAYKFENNNHVYGFVKT